MPTIYGHANTLSRCPLTLVSNLSEREHKQRCRLAATSRVCSIKPRGLQSCRRTGAMPAGTQRHYGYVGSVLPLLISWLWRADVGPGSTCQRNRLLLPLLCSRRETALNKTSQADCVPSGSWTALWQVNHPICYWWNCFGLIWLITRTRRNSYLEEKDAAGAKQRPNTSTHPLSA